jgi:tetratricopeptide (TPR) repeat protein
MRGAISLTFLVAGLIRSAPAAELDKDALGKTTRLPCISTMIGVGLDSERGFYMGPKDLDYPAEIAKLQKEMKGDDSDAERYVKMAGYFGKLKDKTHAEEASKKALELYRSQLKKHPKDPAIQAGFAGALYDTGKPEEGEKMLRQSIKAAPKSWECWLELGNRLITKAVHEFMVDLPKGTELSTTQAMEWALQGKLSKTGAEKSLKAQAEAMHCFDQAASKDTMSAKPFAERAISRWILGCYSNVCHVALGQPMPPPCSITSEASLADTKRAAELAPNDPQIIGFAALFEAAHVLQQRAGQMDEATRRRLRATEARLTEMGKSQDAKTSCDALELAATLRFCWLDDFPGAAAHLQVVVKKDPGRETSWDTLIPLLAKDLPKTSKEIIAACQQRLKYKDTAKARFLFAKVYEELGQLTAAEEQLRAGLKGKPDDLYCMLGLAAVLMQRSKENAALAEAGKLLDKAEKALAANDPASLRVDARVLRCVYKGLTGEVDVARDLLKEIARMEDHRVAKAALAVLEK